MTDGKAESNRTVVIAMLANLGIAVAKGVAGVLSGSAAMLSEAAHSLADTTNEVLLLVAVKRSSKPADEQHPLGYGRERYFWSLLAAVGIFVGGGVFAVLQGVHELVGAGGEGGHYVLTYAVLAIAALLEGVSWVQAIRQLREDAGRANRRFRDQVWGTTDPATTTVFFEDSAALAGLFIAGLGVGLHQATGHYQWDSAASIAIGVLLAVVAFLLGRENRSLIVGEAADPRLRRAVEELLSSYDEVTSVDQVIATVTGRGQVFVAAYLDLEDQLTAAQVEALARRMEQDVKEKEPFVQHFFIDVTADAATT